MNSAKRDFTERMIALTLGTCGFGWLLIKAAEIPGPEGAALAYAIGGVIVAGVVTWWLCSGAKED